MRDVPEIRFKGFSDAWVQRKLSSLVDFSNGINAPKEQYGKGRKMISVMDILSDEPIKYSIIKNSVEVDDKTKNNFKVECGDLVFVRSSEVASEVGWAKAYTDDEYALFSGFSIRGNKKSDFDNCFIELSLNSKNRAQIESKTGGSTRFNVNQSILSDVAIFQPNLTEQTAIGNFFHALDKTITLLKRKLDKLKQLKKAYLQQMFPQAGERVPKVRFAGFSGDWEERRLGEVIEKLKSYSLSREAETNEVTGYRYIHYGDIHKQVADIVVADEQLPHIKEGNYIPIEKGDLVLADASEDYVGIAEPCIILHTPKDKIIAGLHTIAIRPVKSNPLYLYFLFHTDEFRKFGKYVGTGLKVFGITYNNLAQYAMVLPSFEEQTAIGNFFRNLDEQITAQQIKLDNLKQLKSAYLQKMFV